MSNLEDRAKALLSDGGATAQSTGGVKGRTPRLGALRAAVLAGAKVVALAAVLGGASVGGAHAQSMFDEVPPPNYGVSAPPNGYQQQQFVSQLQQLVNHEVDRRNRIVRSYSDCWRQPMTPQQVSMLDADIQARINDIQQGNLHGLTPAAYDNVRNQQTNAVVNSMYQQRNAYNNPNPGNNRITLSGLLGHLSN
jgi:hypothetical protein